jgi:dipeptidyl aminopeptidase/acylaminoacyl peptidase
MRGRSTTVLPEVWLLTVEGQRRKIADDGHVAAWSPDGTRLATYRVKGHEIENVLLEVATGRASLLPVPKTDVVWDWSPDGKAVVWLVPRRKVQSAETHPELVIITLSTGKVDRLDLFQRGLDWVQAIDWR